MKTSIFSYKIPPEVSGEAQAILTHIGSIQYMLQICPNDREEYWLQRFTDEKLKMNEFHERIVRQYYKPSDFDIDKVIMTPSIHWMSNVLEIRITELSEKEKIISKGRFKFSWRK